MILQCMSPRLARSGLLDAIKVIGVPTITLEGDANGAPHAEPGARAEILRQIRAPDDHRRHRSQSAAGGAAGVCPSHCRCQFDLSLAKISQGEDFLRLFEAFAPRSRYHQSGHALADPATCFVTDPDKACP